DLTVTESGSQTFTTTETGTYLDVGAFTITETGSQSAVLLDTANDMTGDVTLSDTTTSTASTTETGYNQAFSYSLTRGRTGTSVMQGTANTLLGVYDQSVTISENATLAEDSTIQTDNCSNSQSSAATDALTVSGDYVTGDMTLTEGSSLVVNSEETDDNQTL